MPLIQKVFVSFSTGEITPRLSAKIDFAKYLSGCEKLENFIIFPHGGVTRRPGLRYVAETKDSTKTARVVKFQFSVTDAYILEFGDLYVRFYRNQAQIQSGGSPVEVVTPYTEAQLFELQFAQSADVMYITHGSHAPRKLTRASHTSWTLATVSFNPAPSFVDDTDLNEGITLSALTGDGVTITPDTTEDLFLPADVGREIVSGVGRGTIISHDAAASPDEVDMDVIDDFTDLTPAAGEWEVTGSPNSALTPSAVGPFGGIINLSLAAAGWRDAGAPGGSDIGKFVKVNNGLLKITAITSTTVAKGKVLRVLDSTTAAAGGLWTLNVESWDATRGFPTSLSFFENRLFYARTDTQPQTIWGSVIDDFENFAVGTDDDDSLDYTITGQNPIIWISDSTVLTVGTLGNEFILGTTNDAAMTPTNVRLKRQTTHGSTTLQPLKIGEATIFVQRAKRKTREFIYVFENDGFKAPDLTLLAEHITKGGIDDVTYQQELDSIIYMVRNDGQLIGITYLREQNIVGAHRHITGAANTDKFESAESIPISDKDQTWAVVQRTINGATKRYIEYFDEDAWSGATEFDQWNQLNTDSALIYSGVAVTTITALHLAGETVDVIENGAPATQKVASATGVITLDGSPTEVEVGLPYTSEGDTTRPEVELQTGTSQGRVKGWASITARVLESLGGTIQGDIIQTRKPSDPMDEEPPLWSEDFKVHNVGYDKHGRINFKQTQPAPFTLLSLSGRLDIESF